MKIKWRGVSSPNLWFHHPRAFWESNWYKLPLRRRWYLAIHDPLYIGVWVGLITVMVTVAILVV